MLAVSIVIPTLDEPDLRSLLGTIANALASTGWRLEFVVVDDSVPHGHEAAKEEVTRFTDAPARVIAGRRRGKGDAVRQGLLEANGDVVAFLDADTELRRIELLPRFVDAIVTGGADVVIAERRSKWQYRNLGRFVLSVGLWVAQRVFIFQSTRFFDTQCGFKLFTRDAARKLAGVQTVDGGMFDIEYLYAALKNGLQIEQIAVPATQETRGSRIRVLRCLATDPPALMRVKVNGLLGRYRFEAKR